MTPTKIVTRKYVPLDEDDVQLLRRVKEQGSDEAAALEALTGTPGGDGISDARLLRALVEAGSRALEEKALEIGYAREAAFAATHPEVQAWRRGMRTRRLRPFMDDTQAGAA